MAGVFEAAMRSAYAEKGLEIPEKKTITLHVKDEVRPSQPKKKKKKRHNSSPKSSIKVSTKQEQARLPDLSCYEAPRKNVSPPPAKPDYELIVPEGAQLAIIDSASHDGRYLENYLANGNRVQAYRSITDERSVSIGLDFGTSSIKIVIGDSALEKAFAVPFRDLPDIGRYLLPSRLYETDGKYSLVGGSSTHRDLKLALVASPQNIELQIHVTAFLALVIRHARGWLFDEHADLYSRTKIYWKLAVGLPVAYQLDEELSKVFVHLSEVAWVLANTTAAISTDLVRAAITRSSEDANASDSISDDADIEVEVIPEIAAQIYGFVSSSKFDKKAPNNFLMVDVGAGTVDSSLFHVKPARGGKWDFEFFTTVVEPHGVMNLHRHRIDWWQKALRALPEEHGEKLAELLESRKFPTDRVIAIPECVTKYLVGPTLNFREKSCNPDHFFYQRKVVAQVRGKTYWRTWKDGFLTSEDLKEIPVFYCGGGMRMSFYNDLRHEMRSMPNFTWLCANPRTLTIPGNLEAPGLKREDYDRLSVAYGLSLLEVGKVVRALPKPKIDLPMESSWRDNYVDKDQC